MARISTNNLRESVTSLLEVWGMPSVQAMIVADTVVYAHTHEKHTHGISRMPIYKAKIDNGLMPKETQVQIVTDSAAITVFDCNNGMGQVAAKIAMEKAVEKAREYGVGASFVRNSNNFGVAGYFGELAANAGMAGLVITASAPAIAPEGGHKSIFGTNPLCCSFPSIEGNITLDMAMSAAARGKIRLAEKNGEKIPFGWAVDKDGNPTDDPTEALKGNMLAIGGVKGFGLALVVDLVAGMLSGSAFGGNIKPLAAEDEPSRHGHLMMAIDIIKLMSREEYDCKIAEFVSNIKACGEDEAIYLPGERSYKKSLSNRESFEIKDKQVDDYNELVQKYQVANQLIKL